MSHPLKFILYLLNTVKKKRRKKSTKTKEFHQRKTHFIFNYLLRNHTVPGSSSSFCGFLGQLKEKPITFIKSVIRIFEKKKIKENFPVNYTSFTILW